MAIFDYEIGPHKLDAKLYAYVDAGAAFTASGSVRWETLVVTLTGNATFDLIRGYADARGSFTETYKDPPNAPPGIVAAFAQPSIYNAWIVKGSAGYYIYEGLQGTLTAEVSYFRDFTIYELDGLPADFPPSNGWSYEKVYYKPF
jgi:hypothetical protein